MVAVKHALWNLATRVCLQVPVALRYVETPCALVRKHVTTATQTQTMDVVLHAPSSSATTVQAARPQPKTRAS